MVPIQEKCQLGCCCRCKNQRWEKIVLCKIFDIKYWWGAFIYICLVKQYPSLPPSLCCSCLINDYTCFLCQLKLSFRLIKKCPSRLGTGRGLAELQQQQQQCCAKAVRLAALQWLKPGDLFRLTLAGYCWFPVSTFLSHNICLG